MQTIVPLADSSVRGPLGVAHLPRLWMKRLLHASGRLHDGYRTGSTGRDGTLLAHIGLDPAATFDVLDTRPTYLAFESWVRSHATLDEATVRTANAATATSEQQRTTVLRNALEDWTIVYRAAVAGALEPIVPAISSQSAGPLGLQHLPRFWLKALLHATGALYDGWKSGPASGFDTWFAGVVEIDVAEAVDRVRTTLPAYLDFERWFAANARNVSPDAIARVNHDMAVREKPEPIAAAERAVLGIDDPTYRLSREINDLVDWHTLHGIVTAPARSASRGHR
jgi:hypothetical protein